jgi:hypothetical protein
MALSNHLYLNDRVNIHTQLTPGSDTSFLSQEDYSLWDQNDDSHEDVPSSPLTPLSTYELDGPLETYSAASARYKSDPGSDNQPSIFTLSSLQLDADEGDIRKNRGPKEEKLGWLFGKLQTHGTYLESLDGEAILELKTQSATARPKTRFSIDFNFLVVASKSRIDPAVNSSPSDRRYNKRPSNPKFALVSAPKSTELHGPDEQTMLGNDNYSRPKSCRNGNQKSCLSVATSSASNDLRGKLLQILPLDTRERLRDVPKRCVASSKKKGHPRCKNPTKGSLQVINRVLSSLAGSTLDSLNDDALTLVQNLIASALCGQRHSKNCSSDFDDICRHISDMSDNDHAAFKNWIKALASEPQSTKTSLQKSSIEQVSPVLTLSKAVQVQKSTAIFPVTSHPVTRSMTHSSPRKSTSLVQPAIDSRRPYFQNFVLQQPGNTANLSTSAVLRKLLTRPLTVSELDGGYIYMYWFPGNFGYVKIGYTRGDPAERLKKWEKQCKHAVQGFDMPLIPVSHVYRMEKLIHAELKEVRYREKGCPGCGRDHVEWFRESPAHAHLVFDKWAAWMATEPYEYVGGKSGTGYELKQNIGEEKIKELCKPVERLISVTGRTRNLNSRRKSGRRSY